MVKMIKTQRQDFVNEFCEDFNKTIKGLLDLLNRDNWERVFIEEVFEQQTAKKASLLSPFIDSTLERVSTKMKLNWEFIGHNSYDSIFNNKKLEHKFSLSDNNTWSAHPYSYKVPLHLLIKMKIDNNLINKLFMIFVNFNGDNCNYSLNNNPKKSSFSDIKIHNNDYFDNRYELLIGQLLPKRKWCEPILETI